MATPNVARSLTSRARKKYERFVLENAERIVRSRGKTMAVLGYPVSPRGRWGEAWGLPDNAALVAVIQPGEPRYRAACTEIAELTGELSSISVNRPTDVEQPFWSNGWIPGMDGARLYSLVTRRNPAVYLEVGSGNSTKFVRRAIRDHGLRTRIVSIDPHPRAEVDAICDESIRTPLEESDLSVFDQLGVDDICFIDCSHLAFQNSDATVAFLEVVPRLAAGVELGVHDIPLPEDYGPLRQWSWFGEQYLFGTYLLGGANGASIEFPTRYISSRNHLNAALDPLWEALPDVPEAQRGGSGFWIRTA
jgi:hypothetical protein